MAIMKLYDDIRFLFSNYIRFIFRGSACSKIISVSKLCSQRNMMLFQLSPTISITEHSQFPEFFLLSFLKSKLLEHRKFSFSFLMHEKVCF